MKQLFLLYALGLLRSGCGNSEASKHERNVKQTKEKYLQSEIKKDTVISEQKTMEAYYYSKAESSLK